MFWTENELNYMNSHKEQIDDMTPESLKDFLVNMEYNYEVDEFATNESLNAFRLGLCSRVLNPDQLNIYFCEDKGPFMYYHPETDYHIGVYYGDSPVYLFREKLKISDLAETWFNDDDDWDRADFEERLNDSDVGDCIRPLIEKAFNEEASQSRDPEPIIVIKDIMKSILNVAPISYNEKIESDF